jgi:hypothetical protein
MRFLTVLLVAGATLVATAIITSPVSSAGFATSIAGDGWFLTGRDIEAGTYRTPGPISQYIKCSWTTHKYLNNNDFRIRSYTASAGPIFAQIPPRDGDVWYALETKGCQTWVLVS